METSEELLISLSGDLSIYRAAELLELLKTCIATGAVIDLSQTGAIDSCAMQLFISAKKEAAAQGKKIHLKGHSNEFIKMMDLYGLISSFNDQMKIPAGLKPELDLTYSLSHERGHHES